MGTGTAKLWTKDFIIVTIENLLIYFSYYLLIVIIADYTADKFNASASIAGLASGIFIIGAIFGRLFGGYSIERIGCKKMLIFSLLFYLAIMLMHFAAADLTFLIIVRMFHGAAFGFATTATATISAEIIPNEKRGEGTGYYALSTTIAAAMGPLLGMFLTQYTGFNTILIICTAVIAVSFFVALPLKAARDQSRNEEIYSVRGLALVNFLEIKAMPISFVALLVCFGYSGVLSFLSSYTKSINLVGAGSFFFVAYSAGIIVTRPLTGRWFDLKGENYVIYPTFVIYVAALLVLAAAGNGFLILLAGVLMGMGYGNFFASVQALVVKVSPNNRKALAISTLYVFADIGSGFGPYLLGFLVPFVGYRGLYLSISVLVAVSSLLYYLFHGRKKYEVRCSGN